MRQQIRFLAVQVFLFSLLMKLGNGCGMMTHMEITWRAMENFNRTYRGLDIRQLAAKHPDALHTGAVYPDSYYSNVCYNGTFHDTSETTHWMTFIGPALDYFNAQYSSKPIDEAGEKLLTFLLGVMSHDVADVLWHSLGIDQGFIDTMAQLNFFGDFSASHTVADPGGDVVNLYEMVYPESLTVGAFQWYVPIQDMLNIYKNLGIAFNETIVQTCAVELMQAGADAERDTFDELYPNTAAKSAFLISRLNDFFLGGTNEMAAWVMQRWLTAFLYLENTGKNCTNTQGSINPLYWVCGSQPPIKPPQSDWLPPWQHNGIPGHLHRATKKKAFDRLQEKAAQARKRGKIPTEIEVRKDEKLGALYFTAKSKEEGVNARRNKLRSRALHRADKSNDCDSNTYFLEKSYSSVGQALVSHDLNFDGFDDLVIGAPGYSLDNRFQEGRVFVILGGPNGLPQRQFDLETANFVFSPPTKGEFRFGYSVAVVDFNADGRPDIIISAPTYAPDIVNKMYSGQVYGYFMRSNGQFNTTAPDVVIDCAMRFCNFGTTLSTGDVNGDGKVDLIIGSPYATQSFNSMRQNGFVSVFYSRPRSFAVAGEPVVVKVADSADIMLYGTSPYSWFGFSAVATSTQCNLLIGAPGVNRFVNSTVLQMVGAVYCYQLAQKKLVLFATGTNNFANFGSAIAFGYPNSKSASAVVAIAAANDENHGKLYNILPLTLNQSGSVYFFPPTPGSNSYAKLAGDRHYGVFGRVLQFVNANNDGYDDLIVGSPVRQPHLTDLGKGEAVGEMYLYYGSDSFPQNTLLRPCQGDVNPCPEDQADKVYSLGADKAQFGSNAAFLRFSNLTTQIIISAPRSNDYAKQSGKLILYSGCGLHNNSP